MPSIHVWDLCLRVFHWLLVAALTVSLTTGLSGGLDAMEWHMLSGYLVLGLLAFRLLLGLAGRDYGHFREFPLNPRSVADYLQGKRRFPGHNPLGAWMIVVMLVTLLVQTLSGLMTSDGLFLEGPWVHTIGDDWSSIATRIHKLAWWVLCGLVGLHLAAIAYYALRGDNLVLPMFSGRRRWQDVTATRPTLNWWLRAALLLAAAALSWALINLP